MTFAAKTKVPMERTRTEIERTLTRFHPTKFAYFNESGRAIVVFEAHLRRLRFDLPLPVGDTERDRQQCRQKWRALLLAIKSKLESVESHIETFEEAFLSHIVMPDGLTVIQHARPAIEAALQRRADAAVAARAVEKIIECRAMSDRSRSVQSDLFQTTPAADPPRSALDGLAVRLDRSCRHCGATEGVVTGGKAIHVAGVKCATCDQFCKWLSRRTHDFLVAFVNQLGVPTEPIELKQPV